MLKCLFKVALIFAIGSYLFGSDTFATFVSGSELVHRTTTK